MTAQQAIQFRLDSLRTSKILALASYLQTQYPLLSRLDALRQAKDIVRGEQWQL